MKLYLHPFSSYCQKAVTAFYEKGVPFEPVMLDGSQPAQSEFAALWPVGKFPLLVDDGHRVFDATAIIEYLDALYPAPPLLPAKRLAAAEARMWDRFFDNYIQTPVQQIVGAAIGRAPNQDDRWRAALDTGYAVLDEHMADRTWAAADTFTLADCAAAPALLYADWTHPVGPRFAHVHAYRVRLLARPSYARALDEARPYRHLFPLGAPQGRD